MDREYPFLFQVFKSDLINEDDKDKISFEHTKDKRQK